MTEFAKPGWFPQWDNDLEYGQAGEAFICEVFPEIDDGRTEVKRKRYIDDLFYVEYECRRADGWQPSGIATSTASMWAFVIADTGLALVVPKVTVVEVARKVWNEKPSRHKQCVVGSHPTKGVLVSFQEFMDFHLGYEGAVA